MLACRHRRFPRSPRTEVSSLLPISLSPPLPTRPHSAPQTRGRQLFSTPNHRRTVGAGPYMHCNAIPHAGKKRKPHTRRCRLVLACRPANRFQRKQEVRQTPSPLPPTEYFITPRFLLAVAGRCTEADKAALARGAITLPTRGNCAFPLSSLLG